MKKYLALLLAAALVHTCALAGATDNALPYLSRNAQWLYVASFENGYARVEMTDGEEGYIDPYGRFYAALPKTAFDMQGFLPENAAEEDAPSLMNRGDEYLFSDAHGNILLRRLDEAHAFSQGVAAVKKEGVWYVIDANTLLQNAANAN